LPRGSLQVRPILPSRVWVRVTYQRGSGELHGQGGAGDTLRHHHGDIAQLKVHARLHNRTHQRREKGSIAWWQPHEEGLGCGLGVTHVHIHFRCPLTHKTFLFICATRNACLLIHLNFSVSTTFSSTRLCTHHNAESAGHVVVIVVEERHGAHVTLSITTRRLHGIVSALCHGTTWIGPFLAFLARPDLQGSGFSFVFS
jgi:hypothetical protein